jgi:cytochrome c-type biogenesis protein CcmH
MRYVLFAVAVMWFAGLAAAQDAALADPAAEARAQDLMRELRCVACENEPVSQSAAPIAEDMRTKIRELVASGASDAEVLAWFEARYGAFVRFRPKGDGVTGGLLWAGPFLLLALGAGLVVASRKPGGTAPSALPPEHLD